MFERTIIFIVDKNKILIKRIKLF